MSIFKNKLLKFFGTAWDTEYEQTLCNELIQYKERLLQDETQAQGFIKTFVDSNLDLVEMCSYEFKEAIHKLSTYMTEAQEYTGVWENVSLKITDTAGMKIMPEDIKKVKKMALNRYGIKITEKDLRPVKEIIVLTLPLGQLVRFEKDLKKINPDLVANIVDLNAHNLNIANRVNRIEKEKEREREALAEPDPLEVYELYENDTADISVYDAPIALYRRRLSQFDPYGTASNKSNKDEKTKIKTAFDKITEAIEGIDLDEMEVVASNINEDVAFAKVIIKEGKEERTVDLLKEMVIDYIVDHGHVSDYIGWDGKFDLRRYLKSRPKFIVNQIFKECITEALNVLTEAAIERKVEDYNEWKSAIATKTQNAYQIKRTDNDTLNTEAVDARGNVVGIWDPVKLLGYIYK